MHSQRSLIRYMGTKSAIAQTVRGELVNARPSGWVLDLFSGMGAVAKAVSPASQVWLNDALAFPSVFARAQFTDLAHPPAKQAIEGVEPLYREALQSLQSRFSDRLAAEVQALQSRRQLALYLDSAVHVGNSETAGDQAVIARASAGEDHYQLAALYFSAGYFSLQQAIELDALRYAIDQQPPGHRDWLLAAWLSAAAALVNAPGHTAQFLRPNSALAFARIARKWQRSPWLEFADRLPVVSLLGGQSWRKRNRVTTRDALELLRDAAGGSLRAVYADPPYTRDHYSRYYHVYETLYLYDYPDAAGVGRYRSDRFASPFSIRSKVVEAFTTLLGLVRDLAAPLVLSYPSNGLLCGEADLMSLLRQFFNISRVYELETRHSTLGAAHGSTSKLVTEKIYVCNA